METRPLNLMEIAWALQDIRSEPGMMLGTQKVVPLLILEIRL